jgi:hypothetical protein
MYSSSLLYQAIYHRTLTLTITTTITTPINRRHSLAGANVLAQMNYEFECLVNWIPEVSDCDALRVMFDA